MTLRRTLGRYSVYEGFVPINNELSVEAGLLWGSCGRGRGLGLLQSPP